MTTTETVTIKKVAPRSTTTGKSVQVKKKVTASKKVVEKPKATAASLVKEVTPRNKVTLIEKVISNREVKYIYPANVVDTLSRKSWRQSVRNKLDKLERDYLRIQDQDSKEAIKAKKVYEEYRKTVIKV